MLKPLLRALWPLASIACSATSPAIRAQSVDAASGSNSPTPDEGGGGGNPTTGADAAPTGGDDSAGGSEGAAFPADGPTSSGDGSTEAGTSGDGGSAALDAGGLCPGLFCEDFEQRQIDPAKWDLQMGGGGTEMIQQQTVAHGKYAMHVHGTGSQSDFAMILTRSAPPALQGSGPVFGRAYLFTPTLITSQHTELAFAGTTGFPTHLNYMEFAERGGGSWQLGFDLFNPAPSVAPGFVEEASYPPAHDKMPLMTWSCIEWEFSDQPDMMVLWVDGKQIDQFDAQHIDYTTAARNAGSVLNRKSSGIIGGFTVFGFGFHAWHPSSAFDLYYDDIVLDTKRVNCLP